MVLEVSWLHKVRDVPDKARVSRHAWALRWILCMCPRRHRATVLCVTVETGDVLIRQTVYIYTGLPLSPHDQICIFVLRLLSIEESVMTVADTKISLCKDALLSDSLPTHRSVCQSVYEYSCETLVNLGLTSTLAPCTF